MVGKRGRVKAGKMVMVMVVKEEGYGWVRVNGGKRGRLWV